VECQEFKPVKISAGKKFEFQFSKMGGDDIARAAEWFQGQWKKHAGVEVELQGQEQAVYLSGLRVKPPAIFRKGVSLDRPTCLAAVELFEKDHPENYIRLNDPEFEKLVQKLRKSKTESERKKACTAAVAKLLKSERLIPLGEMHFTVLASTKFKGWGLNELNQLDLSHLAGP
jgi:oligopeptide transport system substrate-binding protein